jgi:putative membrane-bound dehydrogenase-like protein
MPRALLIVPALLVLALRPHTCHADDAPRAHDPALEVTCFAAAPDIVHPVGAAFDRRGRLLVIESHTHFRPKDYKGPPHDRIRILEDTDGDGKADRFTTFYEGTRATMAIAAHPDGSIYIATRNEVLRLRDTKRTGSADEVKRIAFLDTKGDYPHNGLGGLEFDSRGNLYFGMGENLGADYKLIGADGTTLTGGGEGGSIYWCTADGKKLRKVATGFWNPFGVCRDIYGRLFAVDNDPDSMPPCRMLHVVEGGDYGYQFRYGRSGRHPFQSWDGQLPGTLPMVTGVGEAPCQIISYESDGLPAAYRGSLLVASWADHRIERYVLKERGASVGADQLPFVNGGEDFRPVGIALAPDGSLFITDWVKRDYNLHGKGAVWHVRMKKALQVERPADPKKALFSMHRPLREAAARKLAADEKAAAWLWEQLGNADVRVRAAITTALAAGGSNYHPAGADLLADPDLGIRLMSVRGFLEPLQQARLVRSRSTPAALRAEILRSGLGATDTKVLLGLLAGNDPFLKQAVVHHVARTGYIQDAKGMADPRQRVAVLLINRQVLMARDDPRFPAVAEEEASRFLKDPDEEVRFLAAKWIADERLNGCRKDVEHAMRDPRLNVRMYLALATALARIDGNAVSDGALADYFADRLPDDTTPPALRVQLLRQVPSSHPRLTVKLLGKLLAVNDDGVKLEAVRALVEHPSPRRTEPLLDVLANRKLDRGTRAFAVLGLVDRVDASRLEAAARDDARLLGEVTFAVARRDPPKGRPDPKDTAAWLKRLAGPADADAGRRVFFHPKLAGCYKCHRCEGRGANVGPDLSTVGRNERRHILESILQPSVLVAPHYQAWVIETKGGQVRTGMLLRTVLDEYTYLDAQGGQFKVNTRDIAEMRPATNSIMPDGLIELLSDEEARDLLAYLCSRK